MKGAADAGAKKDRSYSKYAWCIWGNSDGARVRIEGPRGLNEALLATAQEAGSRFDMFDDDGILIYSGRIVGDFTGFEPLADYGRPNAGCTTIHIDGEKI
jgi:hypothetical protein